MTAATFNFPVLTTSAAGISPQLAGFDTPQQTGNVYNASWALKQGPAVIVVPAVSAGNFGATWQPMYERVWWDRVHFIPPLFDLGFVLSDGAHPFEVFNNYHTAKVLNFTPEAAGMSIDGGIAPPAHFPVTRSATYTLHVSKNGQANIDEQFEFSISGGTDDPVIFTFPITGTRMIAWALSPDWSAGVRERLQFKTDVFVSWSGAEQRRALRISPRRLFQFDVQMGQQERRFIESQLFSWSAMVWGLPIWPDGQRLGANLAAGSTTIPCDTVNRDFVAGGLAMLVQDAATYEVLQVTSVTNTALALSQPTVNTWPRGTRLYPVRTARLTGYPRIARANGNFATAQPEFVIVEPCNWPAATGLPTYRGLPVLENAPDETDGSEAQYERLATTIDNGTGVIEVDDTAQLGFPNWTHEWWMQGRAARAALRSLLYTLRGRQGEIWVPTYQMDFKLVTTASAAATTLDVEMMGFTQYLAGQQNRKDIRIELKSGTVLYRRVTASSELSATTERLTIDSALGVQIAPSQVRRISFLTLCRLNDDTIEIEHHSMSDGLATAVTPWKAVNHDV